MKKFFYLLVIIIIITNSCSSYKTAESFNYDGKSVTSGFDYSKEKAYSSTTSDDIYFTNIQERKIIYDATINITVKNPDSANVKIADIAEKYNGYVQRIGTTWSEIRVKSENLNKAIADISELGKVESKSISGEDVTDTYTDYEIRLENAEKARDRYLQLLDSASNVQETLLVEKELERLNGEIDLLKGKMSKIEHLTEYSTITIYLKEKVKPGVVGFVFVGIFKVVKWLFIRN